MKNEMKYEKVSEYIAQLHNLENILTKLNDVLKNEIDSKSQTDIELKVYKYKSQANKLNDKVMDILEEDLKFDLSSDSVLNKFMEKKSPLLKRKKIINSKIMSFMIGFKDNDLLELDLKDILNKVETREIKTKKTTITAINKCYNNYKKISNIIANTLVDVNEDDEDELKTLDIFINKILLEQEFKKLQTETEIYNELVQIKEKFIEQITQIEENIRISKSEDDFKDLETDVLAKENGIKKLREKNNINELEIRRIDLLIEQLIYDLDNIKNKNFFVKLFLNKKAKELDVERTMNDQLNNSLVVDIANNLNKIEVFEKAIKEEITNFFTNNELKEVPMETFRRRLEVVRIYALENNYIRRLEEHKTELLVTDKKLLLSQRRFNKSQVECSKLISNSDTKTVVKDIEKTDTKKKEVTKLKKKEVVAA